LIGCFDEIQQFLVLDILFDVINDDTVQFVVFAVHLVQNGEINARHFIVFEIDQFPLEMEGIEREYENRLFVFMDEILVGLFYHCDARLERGEYFLIGFFQLDEFHEIGFEALF
jgi:hypothetical protein